MTLTHSERALAASLPLALLHSPANAAALLADAPIWLYALEVAILLALVVALALLLYRRQPLARQREALEPLPFPAAVVQSDGHELYFNPAAQALPHATRSALVRQTLLADNPLVQDDGASWLLHHQPGPDPHAWQVSYLTSLAPWQSQLEQLETEVAQLNNALYSANLVFFTLELASGVLRLAPQALQHAYGLEADWGELPLERWFGRVHPDDQRQITELLRQSAEQAGSDLSLEVRVRQANGQWDWVAITAQVYPRHDGHHQICGVGERITERKDANDMQRRREQAFRGLVDNSVDLIARVDPLGRCLYLNQTITRCVAQPEGELLGKTLQENGMPAALASRFTNECQEVIRQNRARMFDADVALSTLTITFEVRLFPELDPAGRLESILAVARDVTDLRRQQRLTTGEHAVLDMIAHRAPLHDILTRLARLLESQFPKARIAFWLAPLGDGHGDWIAPALPPLAAEYDSATLTLLRLLQPSLVNPLDSHPLWQPFSTLLDQLDLNAGWLLPLQPPQQAALGALCLLSTQPLPMGGEDKQLLARASHLAAIAIKQDRHDAEQQHAASHDPLTGVLNRYHFFEVAGRELQVAERYDRPLSLCLIELDGLQRLNENFGQHAGDKAIRHFAELCRQETRRADVIGRLDGKVFAILMSATGAEQARHLAERLIAQLAQHPLQLPPLPPLNYTLSIGIASHLPTENQFETLQRRAEHYLSLAQHLGINQIYSDPPSIDAANDQPGAPTPSARP